jgi:hypothetical protein
MGGWEKRAVSVARQMSNEQLEKLVAALLERVSAPEGMGTHYHGEVHFHGPVAYHNGVFYGSTHYHGSCGDTEAGKPKAEEDRAEPSE